MKTDFAVILASSFVADLVGPIFSIFIPLFAYQLGADAFQIGIVGGVSYAAYSIMPFFLGRYSDRVKKHRLFITLSIVIVAAVSILYALASSPGQLIALRVLEGVGWALMWPIIDVAISEDMAIESGKSLSIYNTVWSTATVIAPLLGVALIFLLDKLQLIFIVTSAMMVAIALLNLVLLLRPRRTVDARRLHAPAVTEGPSALSASATAVVTVRKSERSAYTIWIFVVAMIFVSTIRGVQFTFFPSLAQSTGLSILTIGLITSAFGVGRLIGFFLTLRDDIRGFLLERRSMRRNMLGFLAVCAVTGSLPVFGNNQGIVDAISFILVALSSSLVMSICQIELISRADSSSKGRGAGVFESSIGIGIAIGPALSGLFSNGSLLIPFLIAPIGFVAVLPVMVFLFRESRGTSVRP